MESHELGCGRRALGLRQRGPFALSGAREHFAPDRSCAIRHVRIQVEVDPRRPRRLEGTCTTTLVPIHPEARTVHFDAVDLEVLAVEDGAGRPLEHRYDGERLRVVLPGDRPAGEPLDVSVRYRAEPRRGIYWVGPDERYPEKPWQVWTQGQDEDSRHWFPCHDYPNEKATTEVLATVPAGCRAISNGRLVEVRPEGDRRTWHWSQDLPHVAYLVTLVVGEFAEVEDRWEDVPVTYYCIRGREADARRAAGRTVAAMAFFSDYTGRRYPYAKYAQVFVADFIFGGMENTSATTQTDRVLHDERAHLDYDADSLVAHELAHQWFGDLLTCREWAHAWLNEGFATYMDALFREHDRGRDEFLLQMRDNLKAYLEEDSRSYRRPIVTHLYGEPSDLFDHHLYEKGAWVLHTLRCELGDGPFRDALRRYVERHAGGHVLTHDLRAAIEEVTGRNLDGFFQQWVHRGGHPDFEVSWEWDAEGRVSRWQVKQTQRVDEGAPAFRCKLDLAHGWGDRVETRRVEVQEAAHGFHFPMESRPEWVAFDHGHRVLKAAKFKRPKDALAAQLAHDPDVLGRIEASESLGDLATPAAVEALGRALEGDPCWGVRAAAAEALGRVRSGRSRQVLAAALATPHPKARRAVVRALGEFRDDPAALDALRRPAAGDPSWFVEAEAFRSAGRTRVPGAWELLAEGMGRESHDQVIRRQALEGYAGLRDERALGLCREWLRAGRPEPVRAQAARTLAWLGRGRPEVVEDLGPLLDDPSFRLRMAVLESLRTLGDARAVEALERHAARALDGRERRAARDAALALREGKDKGEDLRRLRDELDRSRDEVRGLRDRLERLESRVGEGGT